MRLRFGCRAGVQAEPLLAALDVGDVSGLGLVVGGALEDGAVVTAVGGRPWADVQNLLSELPVNELSVYFSDQAGRPTELAN